MSLQKLTRNAIKWGSLMAALITSQMGWSQTVCEDEPTSGMDIEYGDTIACTFYESQDLDSYQFLGQEGDRPFIQLRNSGAAIADNVYKVLTLYGPDGTLIRQNGSYCVNCTIDETLEEDGVHTVTVRHYSNGDTFPLSYILELPCLAGTCAAEPIPAALGYVAVEPCRIVDTRFGDGGMMTANEARNFKVWGDISVQNNLTGTAPAEYPASCPSPFGEPEAVQINVTVVPRGEIGDGGHLVVWPWNTTEPSASWLNFVSGLANVANAGTVAVTAASEDDPDISVMSIQDAHVIIDVLGYYTDSGL
ncbi:hypothetical protein [Halioxenophilus aromaticivorans]|uniref:Uncharacterized protein n=1 Tax=Halioxenophilus aromaticivorans TaxID=1306992 RepID=A0AAV3U002_9ALTE